MFHVAQNSGMATYRWNGNRFVDKDGNPMVDPSVPFVPVIPQFMKPMPEYRSPVDGRLISSRQERKDDLDRNNCREWEKSDSPTGGKFRNERMAKKYGGVVAEEYRDHPVNVEWRDKQKSQPSTTSAA